MTYGINKFFLGKTICLTFISWGMISIGISMDTPDQRDTPPNSPQITMTEETRIAEEYNTFENILTFSHPIMESILEEKNDDEQDKDDISISHLIKSLPITIPTLNSIPSPRSPNRLIGNSKIQVYSHAEAPARARRSSSGSSQSQSPSTGNLPATIENKTLNRVKSQDKITYDYLQNL